MFMYRIAEMLLIVVLVFTLYIQSAYGRDQYDSIYMDNYDGDTMTMMVELFPHPPILVELKVRLWGVDTPEMLGRCLEEKELARKAKQYVHDVLGTAEVILIEIKGKDKYGRVAAMVEYDGKDLASDLLQEGLARPYHGGKREAWCSWSS
jgi:micrococcal nuclease